ncbi:DUF2892 domain-containing protein [Corynebacterium variabile]|uniref:YgaP family membrane protein n=1 Tax=Corynebacterium variabile TaxID=1727 RepID=UPI002FDF18F3
MSTQSARSTRSARPVLPATGSRLSVDRIVPAVASTVLFISIALVALVSPWWLFLTGFVAANLALYSAVGWCPASLLLTATGIQRYPACAADRA